MDWCIISNTHCPFQECSITSTSFSCNAIVGEVMANDTTRGFAAIFLLRIAEEDKLSDRRTST